MTTQFQRSILVATLFFLLGGTAPLFGQLTIDCFPYSEDFDDQVTCSSSCGAPCGLTNGWTNDPFGDTQDWTVWSGATGSGSTGPSFDHTTGNGQYIYMETSSPCNGGDDSTHVESPIIDATGVNNLSMIFWRHMYGLDMGTLHIDTRLIIGGNPGPWVPDLVTPYTGNLDQWLADTVNLTSFAGQIFQLRFRGVSGPDFTSDMALDDISFFTTNALDAAVINFTAPNNPVVAGLNSFDVEVVNLGSSTITSFTIDWEIDAVQQAPYNFTGTLMPGMTTNVNIGTGNLNSGVSQVAAWVTAPNGGTDLQTCNDTVFASFCTPYSGTYLVGAGQFFSTPAEAAQSLVDCGIDGAVTLNVQPGTYGPVEFGAPIIGANAVNTILFDGGDTALVTLTDSLGATILLDGTDHVHFKRMTIENRGTVNSFGVLLTDTADFNSVDSCRIVMAPSTSSTSVGVLSTSSLTSSSASGDNANYNTVSNSSIEGGFYGIRLNGISILGPYNAGNAVVNNEFTGQEVFPIYMLAQDSLNVSRNIVNPPNATFGDGIYLIDIAHFVIEGNVVQDIPDWGIYLSDGNFDIPDTSGSLFANNFVSSLTDYAIYFDDVEDLNLYHNTAYGNIGFYSNDLADLDIRNNIFAGSGPYAVQTVDNINAMVNVSWDYNVYFEDGGGTALFRNQGTNYLNLNSLQLGSPANNANSGQGDPIFVGGTSDLHAQGIVLNDVGVNGLGINVDIDGEMRPAMGSSTVDIGADEFTPNLSDVVGVTIFSPTNSICGDSFVPIEVIIGNLGLNPITGFPVVVEVSGDVNTTINYNYPDTLNFNEFDTVQVGTFNGYAGGTVSIAGYTNLASDQNTLNDTLLGVTNIFVIPFEPNGSSTYGCGADTIDLLADPIQGITYGWYASPTDTVPVGIGNEFTIPSFAAQSTYYLQYEGASDSLLTTNVAGNGSQGNMFDIETFQDVTITGFSMFLDGGTHANISIWVFQGGSFVGNESSQTGWTQLGLVQNLNVPVSGIYFIPTNFNEFIPAGSVRGFYIHSDLGNSYSNGTAVGNLLSQNALFRVNEGVGKGGALFSTSTFATRNFNGYVHFASDPCSGFRTPITGIQGVGASVDIGPDSTTCGNQAIALDATGPGIVNYDWNTGDTIPMITATTTGLYIIEVTDTNACQAIDTANLGIFDDPIVDLGPDTTICIGTLANLDAGYPGSTYQWSNQDSTQLIAVAGGQYSVVVTDVNGCIGSDSIEVFTQTNVVDLGPDTTLCDGDSLLLDAGPNVSFIWSTQDTTQTIVVNTAAAYIVNSFDNLGCVGVDTINVNTETTPTAAFFFTVDGTGLIFDFSFSGAGNVTNFSWDFGDGNTGTTADPSHTYANDGTYTVTVIASNECGSDTSSQTLTVVGLDNGLRLESIQVYPNPNQGQFSYAFSSYDLNDISVEIVTLTGQRVYFRKYPQVIGTVKEQVQLEDLARGMYFIRFRTADKVYTRRIGIQ